MITVDTRLMRLRPRCGSRLGAEIHAQAEFGFSGIQAVFVGGMPVRRFTPHGLAQLRAGLRTYEKLVGA